MTASRHDQEGVRMPPRARLLALLAAAVLVLTGCSGGAVPRLGGGPGTTTPGDVAEGTCWTGDLLGADPQDVLALSKKYGVPYVAAAHAVATWPSFDRSVPCTGDHAVEVVKVVRVPALDARLGDYATVLRVRSRLARTVARSVAQGCMTGPLAAAAARTGLPDAVMEPALPTGATLGWAPVPPRQWRAGQRAFACTLTWKQPQPTRYAALFTKAFPTGMRTCIDSKALLFVDCARGHDRERIAVIEAREAVAAGAFPGPRAIREGPQGRYLDADDGAWAKLDAACTAYLRAVSTTRRLTGVANVDVDEWPTVDGSFPIYCDADRAPDQKSLVTRGSVYDRG
jgi:hypothetical protein